jgi:8-oxo-dGTP pyrophosphatase MutT (NUDIX family)
VSRPVVRAAGGVLWRGGVADPEIALVHRPQYDDWSLPKGKAKPGEHLLVTALREMAEETGYQARIGPYLTTVQYRVTSGGRPADKNVTYWSMQATDGEFCASREVDAMRWLPLNAARKQLTSASDKKVLDSFVVAPRDTLPLLLVRHAATAARTGRLHRRAAPPGLSKSGRAQAAALVPVLEGLGVTRLLSADLPACAQTLAPFAESSGVAVQREALLTSSGFADNEQEAADGVRRDAVARETVVVCGQQRVIARLLTQLGEGSGVRLPAETGVRKGGWWLLHHRDGAISAYERHEPAA